MPLLPDYIPPQQLPRPSLQALFSAASEDALDLLQRLFAYDPLKRITARQVHSPTFIEPLLCGV